MTRRVSLPLASALAWWRDRTAAEAARPPAVFPVAVRLAGTLDRSALARAVVTVAGRHEALRSTYPEVDGAPVREEPDRSPEVPVDVVPVGEAPVDGEDDVLATLARLVTGPIDVWHGPPMRAFLLDRDAADHILCLVVHAVAAGDVLVGALAAEIAAEYEARAGADVTWTPLPPADVARVAALAACQDGDGKQRACPPGAPPQLRAVRPRPDRVPLSHGQEQLWFLSQVEDAQPVYNVPYAVRMAGPVDPDALRAALGDVVERHEPLRTVIETDPYGPYQRVLPVASAAPGLVHDVVAEADLPDRLAAQASEPFDLAAGPPLRAALLSTAPDDHVLSLVVHHVATDGVSTGPLFRDLTNAYEARKEGRAPSWEPLPLQYADFALWQHEMLAGLEEPDSVIAKQLAHWRRALSEMPADAPLLTDRPRPPRPASRARTESFRCPAATWQRLTDLATSLRATPFMVAHASVAALFTRLGAGTDIVVGTPTAGRVDRLLDEVVGYFVNATVLRVSTAGDPTFADLLARVRRVDVEAFVRQDVPFSRLVEELNPARSASVHPLFQRAVTYGRHDGGAREATLGLAAQPVDYSAAKFDLTCHLQESYPVDGGPPAATFSITYDTDLYDAGTARRLAGRWRALLDAVAGDPDAPLSAVDLLRTGERARLELGLATASSDPVPDDACWWDAVWATAARTPAALAVSDDRVSYDYRTVTARATRVAGGLRRHGVRPGDRVALLVDRDADLPVMLLAVFRIGAVAVPLDPDQPAARLRAVLAEVQPRVVVGVATGGDHDPGADAGDAAGEAVVLAPATLLDGPDPGGDEAADPGVAPDPGRVAYLVHTSGSTGRPKGIAVKAASLASTLHALRAELELDERTRWVAVSTIAFDVALVELLLPLLAGGTVHVSDAHDPVRLRATLERVRPTVLHATPGLWRLLVAAGWEPDRSTLGLCGGEAMPVDVAGWLTSRLDRAYNCYGPTETAVIVLLHRLRSADDALTLGGPLPGVTAYVLDEHGELMPPGAVGELAIGGRTVGLGYPRLPARTAEVFTPDPYGPPGSRRYRTGDLVRLRADGRLTFAGRTDRQLKVRGFRIEPNEVEGALTALDGLGAAAVAADRDANGDDILVAYVTPAPGRDVASVETAVVRARLREVLPEYMVPSTVVPLAALPLTPNGKLDRAALPEPGAVAVGAAGAPAGQVQRRIAAVWSEILGVPAPSTTTGFFEQGGHSLSLARLGIALAAEFGVEVPLADLIDRQTIAEQADLFAPPAGARSAGGSLVRLRDGGAGTPLVLVHPVGGSVLAYRELAGLIGERPVYGLVSPDDGPGDLPTMAARYLDEVLATLPPEPMVVGGWSMGGVVAYEMARQLAARTGVQAPVLVVDGDVPPAGGEDGDAERVRLRAFAEDVARSFGVEPPTIRWPEYGAAAEGAGELFARLAADLAGAGADPGEPEVLAGRYATFTANHLAVARYRPGRYEGAVHLVHGAGRVGMAGRWRARAPRLEVTVLPADHYGMLTGRGARAVAEAIVELAGAPASPSA
jgi:amino acid adenylation domain-containing protein